MDEVQQIEAGEREQQSAEHGGVAAAQPPPQQQPRAEHHQRIGEQILPSQGGAQRKESVQQLVQRMVDAGLAFAGQVEAGEQLRHPVVGLAVGELLGVEGADRKMERAEIVGRVDAAGEKRPGQRGPAATAPPGATRRPRFRPVRSGGCSAASTTRSDIQTPTWWWSGRDSSVQT